MENWRKKNLLWTEDPCSLGRAHTKGRELSTWQLEECSFITVFPELFPKFPLKQKLRHVDTHPDTHTSTAETGMSLYPLVLLGAGKGAVNCISWSSSVLGMIIWTMIPHFFLSSSLLNFSPPFPAALLLHCSSPKMCKFPPLPHSISVFLDNGSQIFTLSDPRTCPTPAR